MATLEQVQSDYDTLGVSLAAYTASLSKPKTLPELGCYLVDNGSYGSALISRLKSYIDKVVASEFKHVILFQNKQQIIQDRFPQVITERGLTFTLDTMYSVRRTCTDTEFAKYMSVAEQLNPRDYRCDDVHNQTPDEIAALVKFMRRFTDKPIYGTFGADDSLLADGVTMQDYVHAGLKISRQFFRQGEPVSVVDSWLKSGVIIDGVDLEAFRAGTITTSPQDFEAMLAKCLNAGIDMLTVYAPVNEAKWQMWNAAPDLWQAVQAGAVTVRLWQQ